MSTSFDSVLSEFVRRTCCEPAFARDLLQNVDWDVDAALAAYSKLSSNGTRAPQSTSSDNEESRSQQKIVGAGSSVPAAARGGRKSHHRGLSFCNSPVVTRLRNAVQYDMMVSEGSYKFSDYSFVLPDFSREDADYQEFLRKDLVNTAAQVALENAGCLNWWCSDSSCTARQLLPLATTGDGNCLLHAASIAMWGIHDRLLTLRQSLHYILTDSPMAASLRRRWTYDIEQRNEEAGGLVYSQDEWDREWDEVLHLSSCQERQNDSSQPHYQSLEEIHVFALAHVLHRPVIVISDKYLRDFDNVPIAPIYFGGVYLPLEHHPRKCSKTPLLLTYEASHFSALVSMEVHTKENVTAGKKGLFSRKTPKMSLLDVIPLQTADSSLLPVRFSIDRENLRDLASIRKTYSSVKGLSELRDDDFRKYQLRILRKYMDIIEFEVVFVREDPAISGNPITPTGNDESLAGDGIIPSLERQESEQSVGLRHKRASFFSALAAGFRFGNNKLKLPPDTRALGARLDITKRPPHYEDLIAKYMESAQERFLEAQEKRQKDREKSQRKHLAEENAAFRTVSCQTPGCEMYGTVQTDYLCSHCYANQQHCLEETQRYTHATDSKRRSVGCQDTPGLGGHYDTNQSLPREELSTSCPRSSSRLHSASYTKCTSPCDLRQYSGYYPDFGQMHNSHRLSLSYPYTISMGGFTDAGRQWAEEYERSKHKSEGNCDS